jgi:proline dehydrogenase
MTPSFFAMMSLTMTNHVPDFQNTEIAFKHLSDAALYRAWALFRTINIKPLVTFGPPLVTTALKIKLPIKSLLQHTVFQQFCGGETLEDCFKTLAHLQLSGVYSILDYGVEGEKSESGFNDAMNELLKSIKATHNNASTPFCVFKLTALARFELLEKVSKTDIKNLCTLELEEWDRVKTRVDTICSAAIASNKLVMIDAEETWIQDAIDRLAFDLMTKYNRKSVRIYTTIQMYRTDGLAKVKSLLAVSKSEGWKPGIKLVRGAYMEKERERAQKMGLTSPIHVSKQHTDVAYDQALEILMDNDSAASLCAGTHNAASCLKAIGIMNQSGRSSKDPSVWFAQLLGMSDDLTFNLAHAGYLAAKYVPYGPIEAVLPYLFRRARENTSIAGQSSRELRLIERELKRRKK